MMIEVRAKPLDVLMCKSIEDGGFKGAHEANGDVRILINTFQTYWPNWLKVMNDNDRNMCAYETCQTMIDLHTLYIAKRRKIVSRVEAQLDEMPDRFCTDR